MVAYVPGKLNHVGCFLERTVGCLYDNHVLLGYVQTVHARGCVAHCMYSIPVSQSPLRRAPCGRFTTPRRGFHEPSRGAAACTSHQHLQCRVFSPLSHARAGRRNLREEVILGCLYDSLVLSRSHEYGGEGSGKTDPLGYFLGTSWSTKRGAV